MKNAKLLSFCFIALLSLLSLQIRAQEETGAETAKKMFTEKTLPIITLSDMNGKKVNVADLGKTGKITIFSFWATWCIPCKKELSELDKVYEEWQKKYNLDLVAVSVDDVRNTAKVKTYVNGEGWTYNVLLDVNSDLKRALGIQTVPYTLLVDKKGKIVYLHNGYLEGDEDLLEKEIQKVL
jgi:cytochrome c biogenesis protein CcmG/thiol:disulfide interchange protein DsbE